MSGAPSPFPPSGQGQPHDPVHAPTERLRKLEEHAGFTEYTVEQLSGEIADMNRKMSKLVERLDQLEKRLTRLGEAQDEGRDGGVE